MIDADFKNCPKCGKPVSISNHKGIYCINCNCGLCVPGLKSREHALKSWEMIVERYKRNKDEKK